MSSINLVGFKIYFARIRCGAYVLPVYTIDCSCNPQHYLPTKVISEGGYEEKIFRPKYLKKFYELSREKNEISEFEAVIPHIKININVTSYRDCSTKFGRSFGFMYDDLNVEIINKQFIEESKYTDYLGIDLYTYWYIIDYWVDCLYDWKSIQGAKFDLNFEDVKKLIGKARGTNFLIKLKENTNKFENEMKSILDPIIINPLIDIICSYGYSTQDTLGIILSVVHQDILKYSNSYSSIGQ
ncbi:MAG: hypothetical protein Harvfovirus17_3 [Harvfovirus sp.]|uniref:Uncharacterized protein n=1 Tax=Harvfovirus sp. TaxID=2487768 RepID=A0A3G5A6M5_9VIRU|nr:MAG: hypothetical protein Harvfovirus17_3 [Harvfovirus sp.]